MYKLSVLLWVVFFTSISVRVLDARIQEAPVEEKKNMSVALIDTNRIPIKESKANASLCPRKLKKCLDNENFRKLCFNCDDGLEYICVDNFIYNFAMEFCANKHQQFVKAGSDDQSAMYGLVIAVSVCAVALFGLVVVAFYYQRRKDKRDSQRYSEVNNRKSDNGSNNDKTDITIKNYHTHIIGGNQINTDGKNSSPTINIKTHDTNETVVPMLDGANFNPQMLHLKDDNQPALPSHQQHSSIGTRDSEETQPLKLWTS